MTSLERCWPTVQRALTICCSTPERFMTSAQRRLLLDVQPTLDEVRRGLDAVEQALLTLGPRGGDEPIASRLPSEMTPLASALSIDLYRDGFPDPNMWREVFDRWSSQHAANEVRPEEGVTWGGLARLWTRACVGHIAKSITRAISRVRPDPGGGRQHFIDRVPGCCTDLSASRFGLCSPRAGGLWASPNRPGFPR